MVKAKGRIVLVKPITKREILAAQSQKILLKETGDQGVPDRGIVLSIGEGVKEPEYAVGDTVVFKEDLPQGFKMDGQDYLPIEANKIMGVIK